MGNEEMRSCGGRDGSRKGIGRGRLDDGRGDMDANCGMGISR